MSAAEATAAAPVPQPPRPKAARFTNAKAIEGLRPRATEYEAADARCHGLRLCITPKGVRTFRWYVVDGGKRRKITLAPWSMAPLAGHLTLEEARLELAKLRSAHVGGTLPAVEADLRSRLRRARPGQKLSDAPGDTVKEVAERFYERRLVPHRKHPEEARRTLDRDILPIIGARPIAAVTATECAALVERVVDRGAAGHADKVRRLLSQLFGYAERHDLIMRNPAARLDPDDLGIVTGTRDRWLTADEIPLLWAALSAEPAPVEVERPDPRTGKVQAYEQRMAALAPATRAALKILLLTGVRTGELLKARWADVDLKAATWTVPVENQKGTLKRAAKARSWVVPLAPTALALFTELKALAALSDLKRKSATPSPWVMASADAASGHYHPQSLSHAVRGMIEGEPPMLTLPGGPFTPHDLRRTMRSHLANLRVPLYVAERCLNHSLGKIVQTYAVGDDYLGERREALEKWDGYVLGLVNPQAAKVIPIEQAVTGVIA